MVCRIRPGTEGENVAMRREEGGERSDGNEIGFRSVHSSDQYAARSSCESSGSRALRRRRQFNFFFSSLSYSHFDATRLLPSLLSSVHFFSSPSPRHTRRDEFLRSQETRIVLWRRRRRIIMVFTSLTFVPNSQFTPQFRPQRSSRRCPVPSCRRETIN